jgi:hypothetical protein
VNANSGSNFPLKSAHTGGVNNLLGDGSIRFFSNSMDIALIHAYCTKSGGETTPGQ